MSKTLHLKRKFSLWINSLNTRERLIVLVAFLGICVYLLYLPVVSAQAKIAETSRLTTLRKNDAKEISIVLRRYKLLKEKLDKLQVAFDKLPASFEPVTRELDTIIKKSIGDNTYDLPKARAPSPFGKNYEKQNYTLKVKNLSLEELSKLLFQLDRSENALFIGTVEITASSKKSKFNTNIDVITVRKKPS